VVALVSTLVLALSNLSVSSIDRTRRLENGHRALELARSVVHRGLAELMKNPEYGTSTTDPPELELLDGEDGKAVLTFKKSSGLPYSTNHLTQGSGPGYGDRPVPLGFTHLVGVGTYRGRTRQVEAMVFLDAFPYAIGASGPFHAISGVRVASGSSLADFADPDSLEPACAASNSADLGTDPAMFLGPGSLLTGNAQAFGSIKVQGGTVEGEIQAHSSKVALASVDIEAYDPVRRNLVHLDIDSLEPGVPYQGGVRAAADLTCAGDLLLDRGVLFVDGDLTVDGAVSGSGAVLVTGNLTVRGGSSLATTDQIALLCQHDISLTGVSKATSAFKGLAYTQGGLRVDRMAVEGELIQRCDDPAKSIVLKDVDVLRPVKHTPIEPVDQEFSYSLIREGGGNKELIPGKTPAQDPRAGSLTLKSPRVVAASDDRVLPGSTDEERAQLETMLASGEAVVLVDWDVRRAGRSYGTGTLRLPASDPTMPADRAAWIERELAWMQSNPSLIELENALRRAEGEPAYPAPADDAQSQLGNVLNLPAMHSDLDPFFGMRPGCPNPASCPNPCDVHPTVFGKDGDLENGFVHLGAQHVHSEFIEWLRVPQHAAQLEPELKYARQQFTVYDFDFSTFFDKAEKLRLTHWREEAP